MHRCCYLQLPLQHEPEADDIKIADGSSPVWTSETMSYDESQRDRICVDARQYVTAREFVTAREYVDDSEGICVDVRQ